MSQILRIRQTQRYARRRTFAARCGERAGQWSRRIRKRYIRISRTALAFGLRRRNNGPMMFTHADGNPILNLDDDQSWRLLEGTKHGRLVVTVAGEPDIFPVNYAVGDRKLYLRTAPGNKLAELTINSKVLLEADGILADEAWSVVLRGTARVLDNSADIAAAESLGLKSWVPTLKDFYVEIEPVSLSGRHFQFGEQPEREF